MKRFFSVIAFFLLNAIGFSQSIQLVVLGTAQDAGAPQINCQKSCCTSLWASGEKERVVALGLIDQDNNNHYLIEATPDISEQLYDLSNRGKNTSLGGVFLTHAHMGHYGGLLYLGKEALGGNKIPVFALPKMTAFLSANGPWEQLVNDQNIILTGLESGKVEQITSNITVTPLQVPHRDEYSETVGYLISGPSKKALFIPDIDKWERWETAIESFIEQVDYAFLDATFFNGDELPGRDMDAIPHPFVEESMRRFDELTASERNKIYFIHFNHTNPLLKKDSPASLLVNQKGYHIARTGMKISL